MEEQKTNKLAIASVIIPILGLLAAIIIIFGGDRYIFFPFLLLQILLFTPVGFIVGILGIITGIISLFQIKARKEKGRGYAIIGIVTYIIQITFFVYGLWYLFTRNLNN